VPQQIIPLTGPFHLVGVAGVGMSALAQVLLARGCRVSGSDRACDTGCESDVVRQLRGLGIRLSAQDGSAVEADTVAVVVSTAIEDDNADLVAARRHGVAVVHRAEVLAQAAGRACVAVSGTSGKSTVTGMAGWVLEQVGRDPWVVNGAPIVNWHNARVPGNVRVGASDCWVVEADESDRSLLKFHPEWAVITNVSHDHFDLDETRRLFDQFSSQAKVGAVWGDPAGAPGRPMTDYRPVADGVSFRFDGVDFRLRVPGRHNAENAVVATRVCEQLGVGTAACASALGEFRGIRRRLETVGECGGIRVVDDYAHNPAKIAAACAAVAPHCQRVWAVWRPHGYRPLSSMMASLTDTFAACRADDRVVVMPVYDAGGTADRSVNGDRLVERLVERGVNAVFIDDRDRLVTALAESAEPGDTILVMGARDPDLPALARDILHAVAS